MPKQLIDLFLKRNQSDPMKALEEACAYIKRQEHYMSAGMVRAKPLVKVRPPKIQTKPVDNGWPNTT